MAIQLPALDIQVPKIETGTEALTKGVQLKNLLGQQQLQQLQIQEAKKQMADQEAMSQAYKNAVTISPEGTPTIDRNNLTKALALGGQGDKIPGIVEGFTKMDKSAADLQKVQGDNAEQLQNYLGEAGYTISKAGYDPNVANTTLLHAEAALPGYKQQIEQVRQQFQQNPQSIKVLADELVSGSTKQRETAAKEADAKARADSANKPTQASLAVAAAGGDKQAQAALDALAPADKNPTEASLALKAATGDPAAEAALKRLDKSKREARPVNINNVGGGLTPEALDMNAQRFLATGQMPTGLRNPTLTKQIMNRAGELGAGTSLAANSAEFAANKDSYKHATGTLDTLTAFENVGMKNLDNFLNLAQKIPDTGVPWLNTPVRNLSKSMVGSANMPAIDAARTVALREIARITNDPKLKGVLTDSARKEVEDLIPANATLPQIVAVAKVLKQDVANVHSSVAAQKQAIGQRLGIATQQEAQTTHPSGHAAGDTRQYNGATYKFDGSQWVKQ